MKHVWGVCLFIIMLLDDLLLCIKCDVLWVDVHNYIKFASLVKLLVSSGDLILFLVLDLSPIFYVVLPYLPNLSCSWYLSTYAYKSLAKSDGEYKKECKRMWCYQTELTITPSSMRHGTVDVYVDSTHARNGSSYDQC